MRRRNLVRAAVAAAVVAGATAIGAAELDGSARAPAAPAGAAGGARPAPESARRVTARDPSPAITRSLAGRDGFFTGRSPAAPAKVALRFVRRHSAALGLRESDLRGLELHDRYSAGGTTYLSWTQSYRGIPSVDGGLRAAVTPDGRLLALPRVPVPDQAPSSTEPGLGPADAAALTARSVGAPAPGEVTSGPSGADRRATFHEGTSAELAIFGGPGAARLAWRVLIPGGGWDVVLDAATGAVLRSHSLTREATGIIHRNYPGATLGGTDQTVSLDPWLSATDRLSGPNVHVYEDAQDTLYTLTPPPADEIPPTGSGSWSYPAVRATGAGQLCPAGGCTWDQGNAGFSWNTNLNQAATQLFWFVNLFHDHLRDTPGIDFGPASGSFEGVDPVLGQVDDGSMTNGSFPDCSHVNNAGMTVNPDGIPGKLETYLWTSACPGASGIYDVNGADDPYVVFHEYTHGLSLRLVTDDRGVGALNDVQPGAMGEAWSDWYAEDYLVAAGLQTDTATPGQLRAGRYLGDAGLRTQPFDCPVGVNTTSCPGTTGAGRGGYTYGDFGHIIDGPEVHADGEIWVETLWDLRRTLVAKHPSDGVTRARALITDGMRLSPDEPSFLEGRDAILAANSARGYGDSDVIWSVFAARGMGSNAKALSGQDTAPVEDFTAPAVVSPALPATPLPGNRPVAPAPDTAPPRASQFGVTSRRFRVGSSNTPRSAARRVAVGTRFRFRLSERAGVTIVLSRARSGRRVKGSCRRSTHALRRHARCTRWLGAGRLVRAGQFAGRGWVRFSGRLSGHALAPGSYRAVLTARDSAGNRSRAVATSFTILRRSGARASAEGGHRTLLSRPRSGA